LPVNPLQVIKPDGADVQHSLQIATMRVRAPAEGNAGSEVRGRRGRRECLMQQVIQLFQFGHDGVAVSHELLLAGPDQLSPGTGFDNRTAV